MTTLMAEMDVIFFHLKQVRVAMPEASSVAPVHYLILRQ
jgi:hypothetical protein